MKRCAFILLSLMMAAVPSYTQAAENAVYFKQAVMPEYSEWSEEYIRKAINDGFLTKDMQSGYTGYINRQHFCEIVYNMLIKWGMDSISSSAVFEDTNSAAVNALYAMGIVNGKSEKYFAPQDNLTREEAAAILTRVAMLMEIKTDIPEFRFNDNDDISEWAHDSVYRMYSCDVMKGISEDMFMPKNKYTKEQAITTIVRLYELAE